MDLCANTRLPAMQVCPAAAKIPATTPMEALATSASPKTMFGDLPPSSSVEPMNRDAVEEAMRAPVAVLPVNEILARRRSSTSAAPASAPKPVTTLMTPGGKPAWSASAARRSTVAEVYSDGLMTMVLPVAREGASLLVVSVSGEFHGVMAPTTPSGSRTGVFRTFGYEGWVDGHTHLLCVQR